MVELSGPITGGTRGGAFGRPLVDLATHGYRPADPAAFNGTAIVCWNNVTAGYDLFGGASAPR